MQVRSMLRWRAPLAADRRRRQEVLMIKRALLLSAGLVILGATAPALADEAGAVTGGVAGAVGGAVVGGPVGAVVGGVGGAAVGNAMTGHRYYHPHRYYAYHPHYYHYHRY
jgi:hypothetical protein